MRITSFTKVLFILTFGYCNAQSLTQLKPLRQGDTVPNYKFTNIINFKSKTAYLNDFNNKLLILDFWSTGCASCIESWPKLEKLQTEFGDKIQILLVNPWQDETTVRKLIEKRKNAGIVNLTLPTVCKDARILELFPMKGVPHIVWIGKDKMIKHITHGDVLNSKNIQDIVNGKTIFLPEKTHREIEVDHTKPLFVNGNGGDGNHLLYQSTFSKYVDGIAGAGISSIKSGGYAAFAFNHPIIDLYRFAYSNYKDVGGRNITRLPLNKIVLHVRDTARFFSKINGETVYDNLYVYQLISSSCESPQALQKMMQADLKRIFGLEAKWEKRPVKCLVLTASDTSRIAYREGDYLTIANDIEFRFNKISVLDMMRYLEQVVTYFHYSPYPLVDETGFSGKIGLSLECNVNDFKSLEKSLQSCGMRFKLEVRDIDQLVITEASLTQ